MIFTLIIAFSTFTFTSASAHSQSDEWDNFMPFFSAPSSSNTALLSGVGGNLTTKVSIIYTTIIPSVPVKTRTITTIPSHSKQKSKTATNINVLLTQEHIKNTTIPTPDPTFSAFVPTLTSTKIYTLVSESLTESHTNSTRTSAANSTTAALPSSMNLTKTLTVTFSNGTFLTTSVFRVVKTRTVTGEPITKTVVVSLVMKSSSSTVVLAQSEFEELPVAPISAIHVSGGVTTETEDAEPSPTRVSSTVDDSYRSVSAVATVETKETVSSTSLLPLSDTHTEVGTTSVVSSHCRASSPVLSFPAMAIGNTLANCSGFENQTSTSSPGSAKTAVTLPATSASSTAEPITFTGQGERLGMVGSGLAAFAVAVLVLL